MSQASLPLGTVAGYPGDICATHDAGPSDRISQPNQTTPISEENCCLEEAKLAPTKGEYAEMGTMTYL